MLNGHHWRFKIPCWLLVIVEGFLLPLSIQRS